MTMRRRIIYLVVITTLLARNTFSASQAEQDVPTGLRGPVIGYVLDEPMKVIRPINGILGSSVLGQPLTLPFPIAAAAFSPSREFALLISAEENSKAFLLRNLGGANSVDSIDGVILAIDRVVLNTEGTAAALLSSSTHQIQFLRGLPSSPTAGPTLDISPIAGTITAVAIDWAGTNILIGASADYGALYVATDWQASPRLIASFGSPTAVALLHGDHDVIVADAAVNELILIRNYATAPDSFRLAGRSDGISGPAGLRISSDGRKLYIADRT